MFIQKVPTPGQSPGARTPVFAARVRSPPPEPRKPIQLPVIPSPLEETAPIERRLRRLNEATNNFRFAIEMLRENTQQNSDRIDHVHQHANMKYIALIQELEQVYAQADRARDRRTDVPDWWGDMPQLRKDVAEAKQALAEREAARRLKATRKAVIRMDIKYAERALSPLPVPGGPQEVFGLPDDRDELSPGSTYVGSAANTPMVSQGMSARGKRARGGRRATRTTTCTTFNRRTSAGVRERAARRRRSSRRSTP